MDLVLAHAGLSGFPDHDEIMLAMPVLPVLLMGTIVTGTLLQRRGALRTEGTVPLALPLAIIAATLSLAAAAIHLAVIEEHVAQDVAFGLFFIAVGGAQLVWAQAYLLWRSHWLAIGAIAGNLAVIATWLATRTIGLPIGPTPWLAEPVGLLDLLATAYEAGLVVTLVVILRRDRNVSGDKRRVSVLDAFVGAGFAIVVVSLLTVLALLWPAFGIAET
jgi:hypothetical protein